LIKVVQVEYPSPNAWHQNVLDFAIFTYA
jgi:hypothetical protein